MSENLFGPQLKPEYRRETHQRNLSGLKHLGRITPLPPQPGQPLRLTATTSGLIPFEEVCCRYTWDGTSPLTEGAATIRLTPLETRWDELSWDYVQVWQGEIPAAGPGVLLRYAVAGRVAGSARWVFAETQTTDPQAATLFAAWIDHNGPPAWSRGAVLYHIMLDRFSPGRGRAWKSPENVHGFFGGTLQGVIDNLDYIQSLGVDTLWLSPLFASPTHHGYDATDLYRVEPRLGTSQDLETLISLAHQREMRIVLDFVANHWSNRHPTFRDAQTNPASPYRDWYLWRAWPDDYESFFDVRSMPKLNLRYGSPVRTYLIECARHWLARGVDGFRLDHADGPEQDFWADFRRACRQANPECWLFGEVVKPPPVQRAYAGSLHGNLDFMLARALRETFAFERWDVAQFEAFLAAHERFFPPGFSRPAFLDNHDMNRFLFAAGGDTSALRLAALVLFTLPAPPILYYGTEVGLSQHRSIQNGLGFDEARLPMLWGADQDGDLLAYFRKLIGLRRAHPWLPAAQRRVLHLDAGQGTYAYRQESGDAFFLVALNRSKQPRNIEVPCETGKSVYDRLYGNSVLVREQSVEIHLPPRSGALIF